MSLLRYKNPTDIGAVAYKRPEYLTQGQNWPDPFEV